MAGWNGSGTFVRAMNWVADKAASIKIIASRMDTEFDNYKTGLETCMTVNGQTTVTANIPMNGKKFTGLGVGTGTGDSVNWDQVSGFSRKNLLLNGAFDVWQNGAGGSASITGTAARIRTADCWWAVRGAAATGYTVSQQTGEFARYALKLQRTAANAAVDAMNVAQSLETADCVRLKRNGGVSLWLSFYAKKGANYSGGDLLTRVRIGTGTDENTLDGYTGAGILATLNTTLTTTLTRYEVSVPANATINELGVQFQWTPTGVAGADDSVTIEAVQLERGTAATDFEFMAFGDTLQRCQRYFEKSFPYATAPAQNAGLTGFLCQAFRAGANSLTVQVPLKARKRTVSQVVVTYNTAVANAQARDTTAGADCSATSINIDTEAYARLQTTCAAGTAAGNSIQVEFAFGDPNF